MKEQKMEKSIESERGPVVMQRHESIQDLSKRQEKAVAVMNLVSLEEHLGFTAMKTGKKEYLQIQSEIRKMRKKLLGEIVTNTEGENWCISKHLLATTMRLMETGSRYLENDFDKGAEYYERAFDTYSLFWLLQSGEDDGREDGRKVKAPPKPE
jgi:hypothetical protein